MRQIFVTSVFVLTGALAACAPPQTAETTASTETASTANASNGKVLLQSRDAQGLAGKWPGEYVGQNGFRGQTTLTLTAASADSVNGVFEYRWGSGNYHRHPSKGSITGVIKDGVLKFGSWDLRLERDGEKLTFRTEQKVGGSLSKLRWNKATPSLKSETVGES